MSYHINLKIKSAKKDEVVEAICEINNYDPVHHGADKEAFVEAVLYDKLFADVLKHTLSDFETSKKSEKQALEDNKTTVDGKLATWDIRTAEDRIELRVNKLKDLKDNYKD